MRIKALLTALYLVCVFVYSVLAWVQHEHWHLVTWDSFFYKELFWGLLRESPFRLENHFRVSPLYPLGLLPAGFLSDYRVIAYTHLILSAAYYFSGLFPLFFLGRLLGGTAVGLFSAALFAVYPASIYSSWTLSESVAIPAFLWLFWLLVEQLIAPSRGKTAAAGLAAGLVLLSRPQGLFTVPVLLLLAGLTRPKNLGAWGRLALVAIQGALAAGLVWWKLGYISMSGNALTYLPNLENTPTALQMIPRGLFQLSLHATALWLEGGLVHPTLGILGLWAILSGRGDRNVTGELRLDPARLQLAARYTALCSGFLLVAISFFVARFLPDEGARPVLRYAVYSNLILIPFAANALFRSALRIPDWLVAASLSALFAQTLAWSGLWDQLQALGSFFSNAPALDVYLQLDDLPGWGAALVTGAFGLGVVLLAPRHRLLAAGLPLFLSLTVTRHAWDACIKAPRLAAETMGYSDIHAFCREVETGRWRDTRVYTQWTPHVDYLARYVKFFTGFSGIHDGPAPSGETDFLYLTFEALPGATLEWEGKRLHAYHLETPPIP